MAERYIVIMAGGRGERFWPQSRLKRPKHLLPIVGDKPMLAQTIDRLGGMVPPERILIITNTEQRTAVLEVCPELPEANVVGEPVGRDTAAAVGLATVLVAERSSGDSAFAMLPADAVIHDAENFRAVLGAAFEAAEREAAVLTIGIKPTEPATGYGYIHQGDAAFRAAGQSVYSVQAFKEKPDLETAQSYLDTGEYFWNAGMFIWRVSTISAELERNTPDLWASLSDLRSALAGGADLNALLAERYPTFEKISIDFAVIEKAKKVLMVESTFDWDDVGSWPAVARHYPADDAGNTIKGNAVLEGCTGNIVVAESGHTIAMVGVDDMIVVQTRDATLICPRDKAQDIKALVKLIAQSPEGDALM